MNYEEAKIAAANGSTIYRASYDGTTWSAGRTIEVGDTIGYYLTKDEADQAAADYRLFDFDPSQMSTSVDICDEMEFAD